MSGQGLIAQLTGLVLQHYPDQTVKQVREHLLNMMEVGTYFIEIEGDKVVGYLEYRKVPGTTRSIHVVELITTKPEVIWRLKRRLYALPWTQVMFRRHKTDRWRYHMRRLLHV